MSRHLLTILCTAMMVFGRVSMACAADQPGPKTLRDLIDHSDLIIVATPQTVCEGCLGSGPYVKPGEDKVVPRYDQFFPQLKISQVLKGHVATDKIFWISYTVKVMRNGKDEFVVDAKAPKGSPANPVFSAKQGPPDEIGQPGSPRKGTKYVFFLENQNVRGSYAKAGDIEIIYRNFDFTSGMVEASPALVAQVIQLAADK